MFDNLNIYIFHWVPIKAIWISGHTLSWDARCSGIYIGFGIGFIYHILINRNAKNLPPILLLSAVTLLFFPLFLDIFTVMRAYRMPSNDIRYLTGLLFGNSFSVYLYPFFVILTSSKAQDTAVIDNAIKFMVIVAVLGIAYLLKSLNNIIAFVILEGLAVIGFFSLVSLLFWAIFKMIVTTVPVNNFRKFFNFSK